MDFREKLIINNFLSISHLDWDIRECNIITGEMASGKSICMKVLYFIYEIFNKSIFYLNKSILDIHDIQDLYVALSIKFNDIFFIDSSAQGEIIYTIENEITNKIFDFTINIENEKCSFKSKYLESHFSTWISNITKSLIQKNVNAFLNVKADIMDKLSKDIGAFFPFGQLYFSDLRILLSENNTIISSDACTNELLSIKGLLVQYFRNLQYKNMYGTISDVLKTLHIKDVEFGNNNIYLIQDNEAKIPLTKCSSGQREIFYLLSFFCLMQEGIILDGNSNVLFIEEPEVHLFPKEQKLFLELLGYIYNHLNDGSCKWRFFITTHSPYVLNVFNNMLFKGCLLKKHAKNSTKVKKINNTIEFPDFNPDKISAIFLKHSDNNYALFKNDDSFRQENFENVYLFSKEIEQITIDITEDYNSLQELEE